MWTKSWENELVGGQCRAIHCWNVSGHSGPCDDAEIICVACGGPINRDIDTDFEDEAGEGIHRRCD